MASIGLAGSIIGTLLAPPTDPEVLKHFYRTTRPFGFWKPLEHVLPDKIRKAMIKEHRTDLIAIPFAFGWQITILLRPMLLIFKIYGAFWTTLAVFVVCLIGLYKFWYKNLPPSEVGTYDPEWILKECEEMDEQERQEG